MSTIFTLEWCGFRRYHGHLHGDPERSSISVTYCGFFSMVRFRDIGAARSYDEYLRSQVDMDEFIVKHSLIVRQALERARLAAEKEAREHVADELAGYKEREAESYRKLQEAAYARHEMEMTIKQLTKMVSQNEENPL